MGRNRRKSSEDFKRDAVNQLISSGGSFGAYEEPTQGMRRLEAENNALRSENAGLKQEGDILKKAMGIVSKQ